MPPSNDTMEPPHGPWVPNSGLIKQSVLLVKSQLLLNSNMDTLLHLENVARIEKLKTKRRTFNSFHFLKYKMVFITNICIMTNLKEARQKKHHF